MPWVLDTNMVVFCLRGKSALVMQRIANTPADEILLPMQARAELLIGAAKSIRPDQNKAAVSGFIAPFKIVWPDSTTVDHYVDIRVSLERQGNSISEGDLWIAATARAINSVLVTNNTSEFSRVTGLRIEDWARL